MDLKWTKENATSAITEVCLEGNEASALVSRSGEKCKFTKGLGSIKKRWILLISKTAIGMAKKAKIMAFFSLTPPLKAARITNKKVR